MSEWDTYDTARAKRRFAITYDYIKESVKRNDMRPFPSCFMERVERPEIPIPAICLPNRAYYCAKYMNDIRLVQWLVRFDITPFKQYLKMFSVEKDSLSVEIIRDVACLESTFADFLFWVDEAQGKGELDSDFVIACNVAATDEVKDDNNCTIACNVAATDADKEFAGTFMDGGETPENVQRAQTILAHMKTLGQTKIARYLGGCDGICINNGAELHRWLKNNGFAVGRYQGFIRVYGEAESQREKEQKLRDKVVKVEVSKTNN